MSLEQIETKDLRPVVIVGTGLASWNVIREYRKRNPEASIVVITADEGTIYPKPQLSVALSKKLELEQLVQFDASVWTVQEKVTLYPLTLVTHIDTQKQIVYTSRNQEIEYKDLVLGTGAKPIEIPLNGTASSKVLRVNHLLDYKIFREELKTRKKVTILGAGLIGVEFATDLILNGYEVHVIAPDTWPMGALVPDLVGLALKAKLESLGVIFHLGQTAQSIDESFDRNIQITLSKGETFKTELVLAAIGLAPDKTLAQKIGLDVNRGIVVNTQLQTSVPRVYALGDAIEIKGLALPFVMPIVAEAKVVAQVLSGEEAEFKLDAVPVIVKCAPFPLVILPDWTRSQGEWTFDIQENGILALKKSPEGTLLSVVLTEGRVSERNTWLKQLPHVV